MPARDCYKLDGVSFGYHAGRPVLKGINLTFETGDFCALIGPNGAGKSTVLRLLSGLFSPQSGSIAFRGRSIDRWKRSEYAKKVAAVPQGETAVFDYSVRDVVLMGRFAYRSGPFGLESSHDLEVAERVLEMTDLVPFADRPITDLSGGERQRVLVARALAQEPDVLLLDEPTTAMDPLHQKLLLELLERLNREDGKTVVLASHDLSLVGTFARRVCVLVKGEIVHDGPTGDVVKNEILSTVYGTEIGVVHTEGDTVLVGLLRK